MKALRVSTGADIAYYDSGAGETILFVHSFGHNKNMWSPQLTYFLEHDWRVIAVDLPGHGDSSFVLASHTVDLIAQSVIEVLDALKVPRVVLAGTSIGGYIALRMWARRPDLIRALVLSNTKAEKDTDEIVARRRGQIANLQQNGLAEFIRTGAPRRLSPRTLEDRPWVLDAITMMNFTVSLEANAATLEAMAQRQDDTATLSTIDVPTLIISGSDDAFIPRTAAAVLNNGIKNSQWHSIDGTGHASNLEHPTEFNRLVHDFLTSLR